MENLDKVHKTKSCQTCQSYRRGIKDTETHLKGIAGDIRKGSFKDTLKKRDQLQKDFQTHLDAEFRKLPLYMQIELYRLNPNTVPKDWRDLWENR